MDRNPTKLLIFIMILLVIIGLVIAKWYYGNINESVDPRISEARRLYSEYDKLAVAGEYDIIFELLDSIENIYNRVDHYTNSFEIGVINNNRAAAFLTISLYADSIPVKNKIYSGIGSDSLVNLASLNINKAISVYENWAEEYLEKSTSEISLIIEDGFTDGLGNEDPDRVEKYLRARTSEIERALKENNRRLSVSYTNLGIVMRQKGDYKSAVENYNRALQLWDRNLLAENNLNRLIGKPLKKRNLLQTLFPPDRDNK